MLTFILFVRSNQKESNVKRGRWDYLFGSTKLYNLGPNRSYLIYKVLGLYNRVKWNRNI